MIKIIGLSLLASFLASYASAVSFTNGSLTGPLANASVPTDWTVYRDSPDTNDINHAAGGGYSYAVAASNSPDGGTWVGIAHDESTDFREIFGQTVSGFSIGSTYSISWSAANFGFAGYTTAASIGVTVDGVQVGSGGVLSLGSTWELQSIDFVATATSQNIRFGLDQLPGKSYLQIDGLSVAESNSVPSRVPDSGSTIMLIGLSLFGTLGLRTRNSK